MDQFCLAGVRSPPFVQVIMIDLVLAGDNAVVIGLAAAGLAPTRRGARDPGRHRRGDRCCASCFAVIAVKLLAIVGLLLAGGILLLWVALEDVARIARARAA